MLLTDSGSGTNDRRAVVYRRVSSAAQEEEGRSLDRDQVRLCLDLIRAHDLHMDADFAEAHSARTGRSAKRPVFNNELIPYIRTHKIRHLVVANIDRITRDANLSERGRILGFLQHQEMTVYSPQGVLDLTTPTGRLLVQILIELAAAENERRSGSIIAARDGAFGDGLYHSGTVPYGYRLVRAADLTPEQAQLFKVPEGVSPPSYLVPCDQEVAQLREIIDRFLAGDSGRAIALDLNSRGIAQNVHRDTKSWWDSQSLRKMLSAPVRRGLVKRKGQLAVAVNVVPIIDEAVYDQIQVQLSATARKDKAKGGRDTVLGGLLRCECCGSVFWRIPVSGRSKTYLYYMCANARQHRGCTAPRIEQGQALAQIKPFLPAILSSRLWHEQALRQEQKAAEAQQRMEVVNSELDRLMDAHFKRHVLAEEDFDRLYHPLRKERDGLRATLEQAVARAKTHEPENIDHLLEADQLRLHALLSTVVDYVEIADGRVKRIRFQEGLDVSEEIKEFQHKVLDDDAVGPAFVRYDESDRLLEIIRLPDGILDETNQAVVRRDWISARQAAIAAFAEALGEDEGQHGEMFALLLWMNRYGGELPPGVRYKRTVEAEQAGDTAEREEPLGSESVRSVQPDDGQE